MLQISSLNDALPYFRTVGANTAISITKPSGTTGALVVVFRKANGNYKIAAIDNNERSSLDIVDHGYGTGCTIGMSDSSLAISNNTGALFYAIVIFA